MKTLDDLIRAGATGQDILDFAIKHSSDKASKDYFRQAKKDLQANHDDCLQATKKAIEYDLARRRKKNGRTRIRSSSNSK